MLDPIVHLVLTLCAIYVVGWAGTWMWLYSYLKSTPYLDDYVFERNKVPYSERTDTTLSMLALLMSAFWPRVLWDLIKKGGGPDGYT